MRNDKARKIQELKRIQQREKRTMTERESKGLVRMIADMEKVIEPINRKYKRIEDMY